MTKRVFASDQDRKKDAECELRALETTDWWNDLQVLFMLVRYGEARIPSDLAVRDQYTSVGQSVVKRKLSISQDPMNERLREALERKGFSLGKRVPPDAMFKIAKEIKITGIEMIDSAAKFSPGEAAYQLAYKYASELGYSRKRKG